MLRYLAVAVVGLTALAGCGRKEGELTGTVTFRGKPVPSGEIVLTGDEKRGNTTPGVMVEIKDGVFRTPTKRGHWGGAYVATITGFKGTEPLFGHYEVQFDLPEGNTTYDFVVPDEAAGKAATGK